MADWDIHKINTPEALYEVEELQGLIWPGSELDIVPLHMMLAVIHNGGLLLGAYENSHLIGFSFGFPGMTFSQNGWRLKHCSHMLGVHPDSRDSGVGFALKSTQRKFILEQGVDLVTWTYDPLFSRNAYLNINRLGGVCNTYLRSEYGLMRDGLNNGLASDRFQVDWWVNSARVEEILKRGHSQSLNLGEVVEKKAEVVVIGKNSQPSGEEPELNRSMLVIEIPADILSIKENDISLAMDWRAYTRIVFEKAFSENYCVTDFLYDQGRSFYILTI